MTGSSGSCYWGLERRSHREFVKSARITSGDGTEDIWPDEHVDFDTETYFTQDTDMLCSISSTAITASWFKLQTRLHNDIQFPQVHFFFQRGENAEGYHALS